MVKKNTRASKDDCTTLPFQLQRTQMLDTRPYVLAVARVSVFLSVYHFIRCQVSEYADTLENAPYIVADGHAVQQQTRRCPPSAAEHHQALPRCVPSHIHTTH